MNRNLVATITAIFAFLSLTIPVTVGQTSIQPVTPVATARIPFDFWIGGSHLPAGDYILDSDPLVDTLVMFRNVRANVQEQVFLLPTGEAVATHERKLIFVVHDRQHYLQELWNGNGKAVLTSRFGAALEPGDTRSEVRVIENRLTTQKVTGK